MKTNGYNSITSWIAAFACGVIGFLIVIPMRLAGFFFVVIMDQYGVDREIATVPIVVLGMLRSLTGPFIGYLGQTIGLRATTTLGCVLASVGLGLCFFADNIISVIIGLGFIYGLGLGCGASLVPEILKQHFAKSINTPFGIYVSGGCIGAVVMPKLLQLISNEYGNSGMFLILAALVLNSVPAALILKDPKNHTEHMKFGAKVNAINGKSTPKTRLGDESRKQIEGNDIIVIERKNTNLSIDFVNTLNISENVKIYENAGFELKDDPPHIKDVSMREKEIINNGYFRDTLGSYDWVLYIIAISCVSCAILVTFTPLLASWRQRKLSNKCNMTSS